MREVCGAEEIIPANSFTPDYTPQQYLKDFPTEDCDACEMRKDAGKPGHCIECGIELNAHTRSDTMPNEGRDAQRCDCCHLKSWDLTVETLRRGPRLVVKQDPPGLIHKKFQHYRGMTIYKCTDMFMHHNNMMAGPKDFYAVLLPDGATWLYSGEDDDNVMMFGKPHYARETIDQYLAGQRNWSES
jgi:hypothetical protein